MSNVRDRNESAWLLPNDGSRTTRQLGCARTCAGSPIPMKWTWSLSAAAQAGPRCCSGWRGRGSASWGSRPDLFGTPRRDWVSDEAGSRHLYWEDVRGITGGENPLALGREQQRQGASAAVRPCTGPLFTPRLHPSGIFGVHSEDGVAVDWPIPYEELKPYYELLQPGGSAGLRAGVVPVGRSPRLMLTGRTRWAGSATCFIRGCTALGHPGQRWAARSRSWRRICTGTGRTASTGDFASRAARWGPKRGGSAHHARAGRPRAWGGDPRPLDGVAHLISGQRYAGGTGVSSMTTAGSIFSGRGAVEIVCGYAIETPRLLLNSACPGVTRRGWPTGGRIGGPLPDGAGSAADGRPL